MKKLFISQPMRGKTDGQILSERDLAIKRAKELLGDDVELIDSFFSGFPEDNDKSINKPVFYLGKSLEKLAYADVAYFCKGWNEYRGCKIEHTVAKEYDIRMIEER